MNPLAIFSGPYAMLAKWGVIVALLSAFGAWSWFKGNEHGTQKLIDYQGRQATEAVRVGGERVKIVYEVETKYVTEIEKIYVKGKTITQEVKIYVTAKDDAGCVVPVGFVREYNAAWSGAPAGSPADADRGPSGIPLSTVAETDAGNATACLVYKTQRDGLIEFYRKQQAVK